MILTVDVGNTSVRWVSWQDDTVLSDGRFEHGCTFDVDSFRAALPEVEADTAIVISNVAGDAAAACLRDYAETMGATSVFMTTARDCLGIRHGYADVERHGVDRWAAVLGSAGEYPLPVCIIDAGTAVTVDYIDTQSRHRGGVIMPGPSIMSAAMHSSLEGIDTGPFHSLVTNHGGDITDTDEAIERGISTMLLTALRAIIDDFLGSAPGGMILFTGGLGQELSQYFGDHCRFDALLVQKGLKRYQESMVAA